MPQPVPEHSDHFDGKLWVRQAEIPKMLAVEAAAAAKGDWPGVDRFERFLGPILRRIAEGSSVRGREIEALLGRYPGPAACR